MTDFDASFLEGPDSSVEVGLTSFFFLGVNGGLNSTASLYTIKPRHRLKFFFLRYVNVQHFMHIQKMHMLQHFICIMHITFE